MADLRPWLTHPGSLTARLRAHCREFCVELLFQGSAPLARDETLALALPPGTLGQVREVRLCCDGVPVVWARSVWARQPRRAADRVLAGLGARSLGSLLFTDPQTRRGPLEYTRERGRPYLWARRSRFLCRGKTVVVMEGFLPAILSLTTPPAKVALTALRP